jgi:hypothetical protein
MRLEVCFPSFRAVHDDDDDDGQTMMEMHDGMVWLLRTDRTMRTAAKMDRECSYRIAQKRHQNKRKAVEKITHAVFKFYIVKSVRLSGE